MIKTKKLSDVVATNFTALEETQEGLLRGGFGEILTGMNTVATVGNNCQCNDGKDNCSCPDKGCSCKRNNCQCGPTSDTTSSGSTSGKAVPFSLGLF